MSYLLKIDVSSEHHQKIIMKLCKRNNFYVGDVYGHLYQKTYLPDIKSFSPSDRKRIIEAAPHFYKEKFQGTEFGGYFLVETQNDKKIVNGFAFVQYDESNQTSELLFLLVDKEWRKKGYGSQLLRKVIEDVDNHPHCELLRVKIEANETQNLLWYTNFGFSPSGVPEDGEQYKNLIYIKNTPEMRKKYNRIRALCSFLARQSICDRA